MECPKKNLEVLELVGQNVLTSQEGVREPVIKILIVLELTNLKNTTSFVYPQNYG